MKVTRLLRNNPRPLTASDCVQIYSDAFNPLVCWIFRTVVLP